VFRVKSLASRNKLGFLESFMNRITCFRFCFVTCCLFFATCCLAQQAAPHRPKITGIDHVVFYTTAPEANLRFYALLGLESFPPIEAGQIQRFRVGSQWVEYEAAPDAKSSNRLDHLAFRTDDAEGLRAYLAAAGIKVPDSVSSNSTFMVKDPEGNSIEFLQPPKGVLMKLHKVGDPSPDPISRHLIHAGFIVRDASAEDHFYKDILGFRLYWHGGMKDGETDWQAMQVPDGTDWLEYMLNVETHPDLQETGVMNHISLGVASMKDATAKLEAHGWKPHDKDDHPEIGKDGKWQFDVFDPDYSRVELMEFKPVQKPCCSDFQAPHPSQ
jgi:catechol 2,3-dioxygenase-like lactoylglutathione lyase family enzyme